MIACYKRPVIARFGVALLFGWASWFNATTVLSTPWVYTDFADYAVLDCYRRFLLGPFEKIAIPFMLTVAAGQLGVAVSMSLTGRLFAVGCIADTLLSLLILPLGLGAAFPALVFVAVGLYRLGQHSADHQLWKRTPVRPARNHLQPH